MKKYLYVFILFIAGIFCLNSYAAILCIVNSTPSYLNVNKSDGYGEKSLSVPNSTSAKAVSKCFWNAGGQSGGSATINFPGYAGNPSTVVTYSTDGGGDWSFGISGGSTPTVRTLQNKMQVCLSGHQQYDDVGAIFVAPVHNGCHFKSYQIPNPPGA